MSLSLPASSSSCPCIFLPLTLLASFSPAFVYFCLCLFILLPFAASVSSCLCLFLPLFFCVCLFRSVLLCSGSSIGILIYMPLTTYISFRVCLFLPKTSCLSCLFCFSVPSSFLTFSSILYLFAFVYSCLTPSPAIFFLTAYTATKIPLMYSFSGNCAASVQISIFMCLWAIYIFPESVNICGCSKIYRPIPEIYKYTYECRNWETEHYNYVLELRRQQSFISWNT